ncbi:MAG TPA: SDR family NAD(P)-dependent oxidoreductase [Bacteroidales bacterium]|nr:SDR family NAD(P)-dependent oxidoreductase [Tenuifilaceae bacterium]HRW21172.1 SDR family NAD(P)-dependent oxidoreductase [Bacteroidales bacterium]
MILITGASRGIGKYLFDTFKSLDFDVYGTYNTNSLNISGFSKVNISDYKQVSDWVSGFNNSLKDIILINCAGIGYNAYTHKSDPEKWFEVINVNLIGAYNCIRALLPHMRNQKFGRIINLSSVVAEKGTPGVSAYAASKSALWGLAKSVAVENASFNITINNINLGYSSIGMIEQVPEEFLIEIKKQIPSKKLCEPKDIFLTVKYLIDCDYINGTSVDINGGLI